MELTAREWRVVDAIARDLAGQGVDRNELGKVIAYFRLQQDTGKFLELLARLPGSDYIRSGRTQGYFRRIQHTCEQYLRGMDAERALAVVGWAFRMMTHYQFEQEKGAVSRHR